MSKSKLISRKDVKEVVEYAKTLGFELGEKRGSGHLQLVHKNGRKVIMSASPSGYTWRKNCEAQLRRVAQGLHP